MEKISQRKPQELTETNKSIYGEESSGMKNFVVGAIVGGIIGAATALLYAPKSGSDLRVDVASQAGVLKEKSADLSAVAKEKTVQLSSQLKEQSINLVEKVKSKTVKEPSTEESSNPLDLDLELDKEAEEILSILEESDASIEPIKEESISNS